MIQAVALTLLIIAADASAQTSTRLTDESIRSFYEESAQTLMGDIVKRVEFIDKHTHESYNGDVNTVINIGIEGAQSQKQSLSFTKQKMIDQIIEGARTTQYSAVKNTVLKIEYPDEKTAKVRNITAISGATTIPGPADKQLINLEIDGSGICNDVITVNDQEILQMLSSECSMEMNISLPK